MTEMPSFYYEKLLSDTQMAAVLTVITTQIYGRTFIDITTEIPPSIQDDTVKNGHGVLLHWRNSRTWDRGCVFIPTHHAQTPDDLANQLKLYLRHITENADKIRDDLRSGS